LAAFRQERISRRHTLAPFRCGNSELDGWLLNHALNSDKAGTSRIYVWATADETVVAYFALAPHVVRRQNAPQRMGRGSPDSIPSILVARLALDKSLQGQGYGTRLLVEALVAAIGGVRAVGGRLIVVDAINSAAADFYAHHGFESVPGDPPRLMIKATDAEKSLENPQRHT